MLQVSLTNLRYRKGYHPRIKEKEGNMFPAERNSVTRIDYFFSSDMVSRRDTFWVKSVNFRQKT